MKHFLAIILGMEMGRLMVVVVHPDNDAKKRADTGHRLALWIPAPSLWRLERNICRVIAL
jgi:hypothetical protein